MTCGAGMIMFDDFFIRALFAGIGLAIIVGPLGCLIIWRKMAFFGGTLAHAALLGIALAILIDISPLVGVPLVTLGKLYCADDCQTHTQPFIRYDLGNIGTFDIGAWAGANLTYRRSQPRCERAFIW